MIELPIRVAYGAVRSSCSCTQCQEACRTVPGYLTEPDLYRLSGRDTLAGIVAWAYDHLLASAGALVSQNGVRMRIRTLVPARKPGTTECHWLLANGQCAVHELSPFGCAFFDRHTDGLALSSQALGEIARAWTTDQDKSLYCQVWRRLYRMGKEAPDPLAAMGVHCPAIGG